MILRFTVTNMNSVYFKEQNSEIKHCAIQKWVL